jgi:hypothetical protein
VDDNDTKIYTATYTPTDDVTDTTNNITVGTDWTDAAGNAPEIAVSSANYAVDTVEPTVSITLSDTALKVGDTATVTFSFSEVVTGFTAADVTVANGSITEPVSNDNITYTATYTPTDDVTDTSNVITVSKTGVSDAA